ncbi:halocin C8 (TBD) [Halococcus salifodinae DSM 8989]|uniref:Halocin C8 (TBD) n=1 Tax=Halococcus salifodinae DSM 8989 TaxID=1227456 RepID=M0N127_9EURY|nr:halocin C8 (TBD) [Halococcus salifodinae DSM 8989]
MSIPLRHDSDHRLIIGRDDNTDEVVTATLEQKTVGEAKTEIELSQVPSLAQQSEFPTAESTNNDGLVTTTLVVEGKPNDISVSTGDGTPEVTPNGIYCFNCRFLAALICDVGCASGTAYICGLASVVTSAIGLAACLGVSGAICRVIGFVGCGIPSRGICCRAGGWCC